MFISSYEKLRGYLLNNTNISSMIQLEYNAFEAACVPVATFILHNTDERYKGNYIKLSDFKGADNQAPKTIEAINNHECGYYYETTSENFSKIPGRPIAFWISQAFVNSFVKGTCLSKIAQTKKGMFTGNNELWLKLWQEIDYTKFLTIYKPYNKGGDFRRWYGNNEYVINWKNDGEKVIEYKGSGNINKTIFFQKCITWGLITSYKPNFRAILDDYHVMGDAGPICLSNNENTNYLLGGLNSKIVEYISTIIAPTINFSSGTAGKIPIIYEQDHKCLIDNVTNSCIFLSKSDWDSFETSWDFIVHPLVKNHVSTISEAYSLWDKECNDRFNQLKTNEEELNRIFIDIYGLQDELDPYVEDKDVTVRKADIVRDIKSFISYAVGCMFGRYSLDIEGLAYAGGEWDNSKYKTFIPDADDIIPICDEEYFEDDIVSRFVEFVKCVYGEDTLEENLQFIVDALGGKGNPREVLRNYFLNDFFKDHCNTYQVTGSGKRPIYWLFDSGKKNGFKALVYIHRYTSDLIARMRTGYIHPLQSQYRTQIEMLNNQIDEAVSTSEKVKLQKQLKKIKEQLIELSKYEEIIHHWADKMEPMDLDDGVKANYAKFQELLAKIK